MNKTYFKIIVLAVFIFTAQISSSAQIASGGGYTLDQSVIAGGGQNSAGGNFSLDGTIGQSIAGSRSSGSPFDVTGGFWTASTLGPTASMVTISGKVQTLDGSGLRNARVTLTASDGNSRTILTGKFGSFRFVEVAAGETYIVTVASRHYTFQPQVISVSQDLHDLTFIAVGQTQIIEAP